MKTVHRCALAGVFAAWACLAAAASPTLARIQSRGAVVIAHREASIPLSYVAGGQPVGYSIDVCRRLVDAIARHLGAPALRVEFLPVTSSTRFAVIERGEADLECGSTTNNRARREHVAFTIPHFIASSRLLALSAKPYERIEDLAGRTVASTAGTTNLDSLAREARLKGITVHATAARDHAEGVAWVQSGKAEAFAMDDVLLYGLRANAAHPQTLKVFGKPMTIEPYAIAFARDDAELKRVIDAQMRRLIASKELQRLYERWFTQPIPPRGINLAMPMPYLLSDSLRFPTDYVPD